MLIFEGVAVALLSSYFGAALGILSMAVGAFILLLFPLRIESFSSASADRTAGGSRDTYGVMFVDYVFRSIGGQYMAIPLGITIMVGVILFNIYASPRPEIGDFDTLSMMLGGVLIVYPFVARVFKAEACFTLIFLFIIVIVLVIPQVVMSIDGNSGPYTPNWYVHYMLAAPMAGVLKLLGVEATSHAEVVTIVFRDGSTNMIGISAACAGLYSVSIFIAAFSSFFLVFQRLPAKVTLLVLGFGLLAAYLGNLFRMVIIGLVGYYHGMDALLWAHKNVGWIVFLGWSAVFWYAVIRYQDRRLKRQIT